MAQPVNYLLQSAVGFRCRNKDALTLAKLLLQIRWALRESPESFDQFTTGPLLVPFFSSPNSMIRIYLLAS
jgi:hypothetical protein